jgi:hypothetical protein
MAFSFRFLREESGQMPPGGDAGPYQNEAELSMKTPRIAAERS